MKSACIIAIGDELLNGFTSDTNSQWIKEQLIDYDLEVVKSVVVPDDEKSINDEVLSSLSFDIVFILGGLGPTHDDITKLVLSKTLNLSLKIDQVYKKKLINRFKNRFKNIDSIKKTLDSQCLILENFTSIDNSIGTALGITGKVKKTRFFVLPGVPKELKQMFTDIILPDYFTINKSLNIHTLKTTGITESKLYLLLKKNIQDNKNKYKFSFLPHFSGVNIRISAKEKQKNLKYIVNQIRVKLGSYIYGDNDDKLEYVTSKKLIDKKLSISIAESCTGGLLTKKLTDYSGSSKYLIGSIIAYSNNIKKNILKIPLDILNKKGAVSKEVALEMSKNISRDYRSDLGVSITGISGPTGGTETKPLGLYYISIKHKDVHFAKKFIFNVNDRITHREVAANTALNMIRLFLDTV